MGVQCGIVALVAGFCRWGDSGLDDPQKLSCLWSQQLLATWVSGSRLQKQRKLWFVSWLESTEIIKLRATWVGIRKLGFCCYYQSIKDAVLLLPKWILNHPCFFEHLFQMPWQEESNGTNLNHMWVPISCFFLFLKQKISFFSLAAMMADSISIRDLRCLKKKNPQHWLKRRHGY